MACSDCKSPYSLTLYGPHSPRMVQTSPEKGLVFTNYRLEPTVLVRQGKIKIPVWGFVFLVALVGLEPTLLAELDFESSASTNSATGPLRQKTKLSGFLCSNFFYQAGTAIRLVCRFFRRCSRFTRFFYNGCLDFCHFWCQT